ncbi:hypothetical protein Pint_10948 [Pistacia integerrima]|uniref:Uncharacterized protein n=1 Tax=Pistacia integerrima TaxID=434235 RepID=A0ACC0XG07_9ROSI|nr:hypothetical protein Pint_10948 [Pistacia integerrima]
MEVEGGSRSAGAGEDRTIPIQSGQPMAFFQFTQQNLPACKPVLTPAWVITACLLMGFIFIPIGLVTLRASHSVIEIVDQYDTECVPEVHKYMKAPIYIYYQLDNYYQNHRRNQIPNVVGFCLCICFDSKLTPRYLPESNHGLPIVPCGLIAWSFFNDTFKFIRERTELMVNRKNIAWKSDRDHKFGKQVYPFNFQNGTFTGGGSLDPSIPLSDQEDLIVWMRTAALPSFRKLYGRIEEDLDEGDLLEVHVMNNYNTYSFGGKKKLVLSTLSWLGGKNDFPGLAYVFIGCSSIIISIVFMLLHVKNPRAYGETAYLSWNRKSISG